MANRVISRNMFCVKSLFSDAIGLRPALYHCRSELSSRKWKDPGSMGLTGTVKQVSTNVSSELIVSILGPPNAGKSTLFNRFMCKEANRSYKLGSERKKVNVRSQGRIGYRNPTKRSGGAIVTPIAGTTRDRRECIGRIGDVTFRLVDTAGVDGEKIDFAFGKRGEDSLEGAMIRQTMEAARRSDLVLLLFDARVGVTSDLLETVKWLRKLSNSSKNKNLNGGAIKREIVILANKLEGDRWATMDDCFVLDNLSEISRAGFGDAIPISAEHGEGMAELASVIQKYARDKRSRLGSPPEDAVVEGDGDTNTEKPLQLAILGQINVGKSTLVNSLLCEERVIVGSTPGLTRDSITVPWQWKNRPVQIADTAGIRRGLKRERSNEIEDLAVLDAMRAMKLADVAVLVLDAQARLIQRQELAIADAVIREGRALVVAANKMDLIVDADYTKDDYAKAVQEQIEIRYPMLRKTPVVPISSLHGTNLHKLMPIVFEARDRWARTIPTGVLNRWLQEVIDEHPPPTQGGRQTRIKYMIQTKGRPPTFLLFCNSTELPTNYLRYLTRHFQDSFSMFGMEVRLVVKKNAENPYAKKSKPKLTGIGGWQGRRTRLMKGLKRTGLVPQKYMRSRVGGGGGRRKK